MVQIKRRQIKKEQYAQVQTATATLTKYAFNFQSKYGTPVNLIKHIQKKQYAQIRTATATLPSTHFIFKVSMGHQ